MGNFSGKNLKEHMSSHDLLEYLRSPESKAAFDEAREKTNTMVASSKRAEEGGAWALYNDHELIK